MYLSLSLPSADWELVTAAVDAFGDVELMRRMADGLAAEAAARACYRAASSRGGSCTGAQRWRSVVDPSLPVSTAAGVDRMHVKRGLPAGRAHRVRVV
jgi:hypothetical protein